MSDSRRLAQCEAALRAAGAVPEAYSGSTHRKWRFPDGTFIQMPAHAHRGVHWDNAESVMRRAIKAHGVLTSPLPKSPGMRPSEVDTWVPRGCTPVQPAPEAPLEPPMPTEPPASTTDSPVRMCPECGDGPYLTAHELNGHRSKHRTKAQVCPDCQGTFRNLGRHRVVHRATPAVAPRVTVVAVKVKEKPDPAKVEAAHAAVAGGVADAVAKIQGGVEALRGAVILLQEDNKLLRRDLEKAQSALDRARNFLGSRP